MTQPVDVSAGILVRADGAVLFAQRPASKVYAGYWEFPGGKVEPGESYRVALDRELHEELAIEVRTAYPWLTQVFSYPHATVRLHFFRVLDWLNEPQAREHQALAWTRLESVKLEPMLPANSPILRSLRLPHEYAISDVAQRGEAAFFAALERRLAAGLRMVQLRDRDVDPAGSTRFAQGVVERCRAAGAQVLVDGDAALAGAVGADGVQLEAATLGKLAQRPDCALVGATCASRAELELASRIGADFAVLRSDGWPRFAALVADLPLPVYAAGGLRAADLVSAWAHGAHGLAMTRGSWE